MAQKRRGRILKHIESGAKIIDIKITYQCNNLCRFCVAGDSRQIAQDLLAQESKKILLENAGERDIVIFTGGEPTLKKDLPELISYAREKCGFKTVIIQTNGRRLAYKSYLEELMKSGAGQFAVSIHGHIAALHEYLTQAPGSFSETILGIRNVLESGATLATNTVITKSNYQNLEDIAELLGSMGVKQMQFAYPHIEGKAFQNADNIAPPMSIVAPHARKAILAATRFRAVALTEGFPHCILGDMKEHAVEGINTKRKVIAFTGDIEDFHGHRMVMLKKKNPACVNCGRASICEGPWADYIERFSGKEFKPVI